MKTIDEIDIEVFNWSQLNSGKLMKQVGEELYRKILILEDRLNSSQPTQEMMDKYPSLKAAYEQYRIIYKMTAENDK
jgi:hypothetical protein